MQWRLDIAQFKANITDARRQISLANAEFKKNTAGAKTWAASITGLEAKLKQLGVVERNQKTILQELKNQYETVKREMGEASPEAQRLQVSIANQEAAIAKTEREMQEYNQQLEKLKAEESATESSFDKLTTAINEQESELEQLKQAYMSAKLDGNAEEADRLAREIEKLSTELNQNKVAMDAAAKEAEQLDHSMDGLDDAAASAAGGFSVFKVALGNMISDVVMRAIQGLKELAVETVRVGMAFDSSMAKVGAISGATGEELLLLRDKAKEMGETTIFSATEAADALSYMAMAGWKTEEMLSGIDGVMALAAASGEDLAKTSDIVTDALTAFGLSAEDSGHFADVLAAASSNANTNVSMMGETFKYAAPIAGALGFSVEDTALAIGLMANAGIKGSQAGTSLRTIMTALSKDVTITGSALGEVTIATTNADGSMRDLSDILTDLQAAFSQLTESEQASAAEAIVGKNAMSGFLALMNSGSGDVEKLSGAIADCDGEAQRLADTMTDNLGGDVTKMKSNLEALQLSIYEKLEPSLRKGVEALNKLIDAIGFVVDHGTEFVTVLGAMAAAVAAYVGYTTAVTIMTEGWMALSIVQKAVAAGQVLLNAVMMANPIGLIIAAIAGLVAAFVILWKKSDAFRKFWISVWKKVKEVVDKFAKAFKKLMSGDIVGAIKDMLNIFLTIPRLINQYLSQALQFVITWVANMIGKAVEAGTQFVKNIVDKIAQIPGQIALYLANVISAVVSWVADFAGKAKEAATGFIKNLVNGLANAPGEVLKALAGIISKLASWVVDMGKKGAEGAKSLIDNVTNGFKGKDWSQLGKSIVEGIGNGMRAMGTWLGRVAGDVVTQAYNAGRNAAQVNSPSKLFARGIGEPLAEGIGYGFEKRMPQEEKLIQDSIRGIVDDMKTVAFGAVKGTAAASIGGINSGNGIHAASAGQTVNFYQTIESPKAVDRLTVYRETNSLLFNAKVRLANV